MNNDLITKLLGTFLVLLVGSIILNISLELMNTHDTFAFAVSAFVSVGVAIGILKLVWDVWRKK